MEVNKAAIRHVGVKIINLMNKEGLNEVEQLVLVGALNDTLNEAMVLRLILGEEGVEHLVEGILSSEAKETIEEAERAMRGEE